MLLYSIVICGGWALISLFNFLLYTARTPLDLLTTAGIVGLGVVTTIALDGLVAFLIRRALPPSWFAPGRRMFRVSRRECNFYRALGIKAWKEKVPELGGFTNFHKDSIGDIGDSAYLQRFLMEANFGVVIHLVNAVQMVVLAAIPLWSAPSVWVPIFVVNFVLSMMPVAVLRYNTATLYRLYVRSTRKEEKGEKADV